jgi:chemotaxis-related protein WspD
MSSSDKSRVHILTPATATTPGGELDAPINDCWNRIGVEGNATCRELLKYIHCRNCPVYAEAGMQLLNRPLPPDYRQERAEHYAQQKAITRPARVSVVVFRLAAEWFALPTMAFQEVAEHRVMHSLPHRRQGLALGLVNVRGELIVCASVARLLGLKDSEDLLGTRPGQRTSALLLITNWENHRLALPVEEIANVQRFHMEELQEPPATIAKSSRTFTHGVFVWRKRTIGLLDPQSLFTALNRSLT